MRIGFTYDLRDDYLRQGYGEEDAAEFDAAETIDAIESALRSLGHAVDRIGGVKPLVARLAAGDRWDLVFNYAEGLFGFAREAQVPALLDAFQVPYTFSDGLAFALTLHKGHTKHVVRGLGLPTPDFAVVSSADEVERVRLPYPLFVKPVASGSSVGISAASYVAEPTALAAVCEQIIEKYRQPALVETYLPGRELTVGISGTGRAPECWACWRWSSPLTPKRTATRTRTRNSCTRGIGSRMTRLLRWRPTSRSARGPASAAATSDAWIAVAMPRGVRSSSK